MESNYHFRQFLLAGINLAIFTVAIMVALAMYSCGHKEPIKESFKESSEESKIQVEEEFNSEYNWIWIHVWQDCNIPASYLHRLNPDCATYNNCYVLRFENSKGNGVTFELDENDGVLSVDILGEEYLCAEPEPENVNFCKKAAEKVAYWKSVMKWDERVARILKDINSKKPEEYLD